MNTFLDSILLRNKEQDVNKPSLHSKNRRKIIDPCQFSSSEYIFKPTKEDWKIVKKKFLSVIIYLTDKCNSNCKICFEKDSNIYKFDDINYGNLIKILNYIGKNKKVILFGGEPTVRKDLFKIIKLINSSGNFVEIYTNGIKLYDLNYVKRLKEYGVKKVHFSFDGFREDIYSSLRNNPDYLKIKLKALKNLEKCSMNVGLWSTIARGINDDQIPYLLMFAVSNKHFIKSLSLVGLTPFSKSCNINSESYMTTTDILDVLERKAISNIKKYYKEFKKFKININEILNKIGINNFPFLSAGIPFRIHNNKLEEFIPLEDLKQINKNIKNKEIIKVFNYFIKNFDIKYFKRLLNISKLGYELEKNDIILLYVFNVLNEINYKPIIRDTVCIGEIDNIPLIMHLGGVT